MARRQVGSNRRKGCSLWMRTPTYKDKTFFYAVYEGLREKKGNPIGLFVLDPNCHGPAGAVVWNGMGTQPAGSLGPCPQLGPNPQGPGTDTVTINSVTA